MAALIASSPDAAAGRPGTFPRPTGRRGAAPLAALSVLLAAGCGGKGEISGTVTFQSQPIPHGRITFITDSGNGQPFSGDIRDGKYTVVGCPSGPAKVIVESFVTRLVEGDSGVPPTLLKGFHGPGGPNDTAPGTPMTPGLAIPEKYAKPDESGLEYTVTSGKQPKDFDLVP
jgi:hypothetical protein